MCTYTNWSCLTVLQNWRDVLRPALPSGVEPANKLGIKDTATVLQSNNANMWAIVNRYLLFIFSLEAVVLDIIN